MKTQAMICLLLVATCTLAAPIPKALKAKSVDTGYEGYWEQTGSNANLKEGGITHGKYWKIEADRFYYGLSDAAVPQAHSLSVLNTPDESQPEIKLYNGNLNRLEIHDDVLTWVFGTSKTVPPVSCEPAANRVIYYFKRVK